MLLLLHHDRVLHLVTCFLILLHPPKVTDQWWQPSVISPCFSGWPGSSPCCFFDKWFFSPFISGYIFSLLWRVTKIQNSHSKKSCFLLLQLLCKSESRSVMSSSLWPHKLYNPGDSLGQNTGVSSLSLLQGIFPAQGSNPGLLHCRQILPQLSHKGNSRILEWVAYPFSSESSQPRNQPGVSCITGRFFTNWGIKTVYDHKIYFSIFVLQRIIP